MGTEDSRDTGEKISTSVLLANLVTARMDQLDKSAQDPATAGVVGEPIPAEMVQSGAGQMAPPPGAASGMPPAGPEGGGDPLMQLIEINTQQGMLMEQLGGNLLQILTEMGETMKQVHHELLRLSGQADMAQQSAPPGMAAPKTAESISLENEVPARGRDGVAADGEGAEADSLRSKLASAKTHFDVALALHG